MIRLALLLLGTRYVRGRWVALAVLGALLCSLGVAIFVDALTDVHVFPLHLFGYFFAIEGALVLFGPVLGLVRVSLIRSIRGILIVAIGTLILAGSGVDDMILAFLFGVAFLISGAFRIASANMLRYTGWRAFAAAGALELLFAIFILEPYPTRYHGTLPYCIGAALIIAGIGLLRIAVQLRTMPERALFALLSDREHFEYGSVMQNERREQAAALTVHVWTPIGTAREPVHRPLVDRYIAAVDRNGVISTGHASLEVQPDLYISLYPANDIDHSTGDFTRLFRATAENDVRGRFLPSYREEAAAWCESTATVRFANYNLPALRAFWERYRLSTIYNLTNRNCSSTVAHALETALEGTLGARKPAWFALLRVLFRWEFWVAGEIRVRAEAMAWTPGMVLDYARALEGILHPQRRAWRSDRVTASKE